MSHGKIALVKKFSSKDVSLFALNKLQLSKEKLHKNMFPSLSSRVVFVFWMVLLLFGVAFAFPSSLKTTYIECVIKMCTLGACHLMRYHRGTH